MIPKYLLRHVDNKLYWFERVVAGAARPVQRGAVGGDCLAQKGAEQKGGFVVVLQPEILAASAHEEGVEAAAWKQGRKAAGEGTRQAHGRSLPQKSTQKGIFPMENVLPQLSRLTYKEGYEHTVQRETEKDIQSIHEQYQSIIDILKAKISETDDMVKVKRAAKG